MELVVARLPGAEVSDPEGKRLVCTAHPRAEWCPHMEAVCGPEGLDAPQIGRITDLRPVAVPLTPTRNLWATVGVVGIHHGGMHEASVKFNNGKLERLGILAEGEGRWVIRAMLFDWLRYKYVDAPKCVVRTHGLGTGAPEFGRAAELPRTDNPDPELLVNTYFVLTTGACVECRFYLDHENDVPAVY